VLHRSPKSGAFALNGRDEVRRDGRCLRFNPNLPATQKIDTPIMCNAEQPWRQRTIFVQRIELPICPVRDALLAEGLAEEHRWVPNSGWITFHVRSEGDVKHAVWLMRLSYLRYALKIASDPRLALDESGEELQLSSKLKSLLEPFVPRLAVA
jgi:hypothetical protein